VSANAYIPAGAVDTVDNLQDIFWNYLGLVDG
jgi:hypothetical protein